MGEIQNKKQSGNAIVPADAPDEFTKIVRWRDGHVMRVMSVWELFSLFEDWGTRGLTLAEIGEHLGSKTSAARIIRQYPALKVAYQNGIDSRTIDVEAALVKKALGFTVPKVSKTVKKTNEGIIESETKEDIYFPPDPAALKIFLKGRETQRYKGEEDNKGIVNIYLDALDSKL